MRASAGRDDGPRRARRTRALRPIPSLYSCSLHVARSPACRSASSPVRPRARSLGRPPPARSFARPYASPPAHHAHTITPRRCIVLADWGKEGLNLNTGPGVRRCPSSSSVGISIQLGRAGNEDQFTTETSFFETGQLINDSGCHLLLTDYWTTSAIANCLFMS